MQRVPHNPQGLSNNPSLSLMCPSLEPEGTVAFYCLPFQLPSWSWLPAHLAWEGTSPRPCPACARGLGLHAARMPGGLRAKGNRIVYPTHVLYSLQPTAFRTRCLLTGPLVAALQAHTRPGTLPVTRPGLPTQGLWRAENMGPTQNWLTHSLSQGLECPSWKGPGSLASSALGAQTGNRPTRASISSKPSTTLGRPRPRTQGA